MGNGRRRALPRLDVDDAQAAAWEAHIRALPEDLLSERDRAVMLSRLRRMRLAAAAESLWPGGFNMLGRIQVDAILEAIWTLPIERRNQVLKAFNLILLNVQKDTREILLNRQDFARRLGTAPHNISRVMTTLERLGVITRERRRLDGVQGPGEVVYFVNANVAWNGNLELRKEEADKSKPPLLEIMEGGGGVKA